MHEESEFRVCRKCGYKRGFHVYFKGSDSRGIRIGLICPSCGQSYDTGRMVSDVRLLQIKEGDVFEK